ncbi:DUF3027 domain-containing protein [Jatrophihabitans sp.]|uniref:DUF3027 domain-containing protein n=1 Tax=Jatrophihabitans sp. TaxID=1932789 RepID=UPI0038CD31C5
MTAPSPSSHPQTVDGPTAAAVELARAAAVEMAGTDVGEHLGVHPEGELAVTHAFAASLPGYVGWFWAVTVVRAPDSDPTVAEVVLLPGEKSLRAPEWVPWSERLQPGDLSPGDLLPTAPDDPRLAPAYLLSDDPQVEDVAFELGLGRVRVLSRLGRLDAAERWHAGSHGPDSPMAKQAPGNCGTCGFFLPLAGSLRAGFGVCGNEITEADGQVVSVEFGCGAHSEAAVEQVADEPGEIFEDDLVDLEPRETGDAAEDERSTASVDDARPSAQPAADLGEQGLVDGQPAAVEGADGSDSANAGEAEHQAGVPDLAERDRSEHDRPAPVQGGVEQPPPGDPGQDVLS